MVNNDTGLSEEQSRETLSSVTLWPPLLSVAPMLDVTDKHFRYFMRCLSVGKECCPRDGKGIVGCE